MIFFYNTEPERLISYTSDIAFSLKKVSVRLEQRLLFFFFLSSAFLALSGSVFGQTGPGGVGNSSNNLLWLKADAGTSTVVNGAAVSTWADQSGNGMNATQPTAILQPKYMAVSSSGRPAILLNNQGDATYDYFFLPSGFSNFAAGLTAYVVMKPNSVTTWSNFFNFGGGSPNLYDDAITFSRDNNSNNFWYQVVSNGSDLYMTGNSISNAIYQMVSVRQNAGVPPVTTPTRLYKNSSLISGPTNINLPRNVLRTDNYIGRDSWGYGDMDGEVAEIIIYNYLINSAQKIFVDNYLSSKYGISIPVSAEKYSYDGASGYGSDVAGIGRVDASNINSDATSAGNS